VRPDWSQHRTGEIVILKYDLLPAPGETKLHRGFIECEELRRRPIAFRWTTEPPTGESTIKRCGGLEDFNYNQIMVLPIEAGCRKVRGAI
jgi:hypothetical protein